jgi:aminoglycoside phosphotransferase
MLSGRPNEPIEIPDALMRFIDVQPYEFVWRNEIGGLTLRLGDPGDSTYVKWMPPTDGPDLSGEAARLAWARAFTPVPEVLEFGSDESGSWIISRGIDAQNAVSERWRGDPLTATTAVGRGLRAMHEALEVASCPFDWSLRRRRAEVERRFARGYYDYHEFGWDLAGLSVAAAMRELREAPDEDLVVCHGDACAPNTLVDEAGNWVAHVDLGRLGVGDRWADLAVAAWSAVWNYGPEWEHQVYDAYGCEPDLSKIRFYRLLWELG